MQGLDADPSNNDLIEKRTEAEKELSSEQIDAVITHLYGVGRNALAVNGHVSASSSPQPAFVVDVSLTFPQVGACKVRALERLGTGTESSICLYRQTYSACCQRTVLHANPPHKFCMYEPIRAGKIYSFPGVNAERAASGIIANTCSSVAADASNSHVQASDTNFSFEARSVLRRALAASAGRKVSEVAIEGVHRAKSRSGITVELTVAMGTDVLTAQRLLTQLLVGSLPVN